MGATVLLSFVSLALGAGAWLLFLWAVKSDQYDDVERPKHRMLDDHAEPSTETAAPPGETKGRHLGEGRRRRMKAAVCETFGKPLQLKEVPIPSFGPGDVLIRVRLPKNR